MSHQDKFWDKFGKKLGSYQPEGYQPSDWAAMERLLRQHPAGEANRMTQAPRRSWRKAAVWLFFSGLGAGMGIWYLANPGSEQIPAATSSSAAAQTGWGSASSASDVAQISEQQPKTGIEAAIAPSGQEAMLNPLGFHRWPSRAPYAPKGESLPPATILELPRSKPEALPQLEGPSRRPTSNGLEQNDSARLLIAGYPAAASAGPPEEAHPVFAEEEAKSRPPAASYSWPKELESATESTAPGTGLAELEPLAALPGMAFTPDLDSPPLPLWDEPRRARRSGPAFYKGFILGWHLTVTDYQAWRASAAPVAGLYLGYRLSDRWALQAEVQGRVVRNYDLSRSIITPYYDQQGLISNVESSRNLRSYASLDLPLLALYRLSPRWSLAAGLRYSRIIESEDGGYVSFLRESASFSRADDLGLQRAGRERSLHPSDWGGLLGASRHFAKGWSLHLRYTQGLRDLSPNQLYGNDALHLNSDLHLSIRKNF
jgi:hypothetical protein